MSHVLSGHVRECPARRPFAVQAALPLEPDGGRLRLATKRFWGKRFLGVEHVILCSL
jgi:hypothetical protein